jgi:hypothetical protein
VTSSQRMGISGLLSLVMIQRSGPRDAAGGGGSCRPERTWSELRVTGNISPVNYPVADL